MAYTEKIIKRKNGVYSRKIPTEYGSIKYRSFKNISPKDYRPIRLNKKEGVIEFKKIK